MLAMFLYLSYQYICINKYKQEHCFVIYLLFSFYIILYNKKSNNSNVLTQCNVDR